MTTHTYTAQLTWSGSTAEGVRAYDRTHRVTAPPARTGLALSADPAFRGDAELLNPEQLLVAAAASCQLLSFLGAAARAGVDVLAYEDRAAGFMDLTDRPARISRILLAPTVTTPADLDEVARLVRVAHEQCYIANSLTSEVQVQAKVVAP